MEKNKYIEALDTLIRFYRGKIAELEAMKLEVISESTEEKPKPERRVISVNVYYDIMTGHETKRIRYEDGTYEDIDLGELKR